MDTAPILHWPPEVLKEGGLPTDGDLLVRFRDGRGDESEAAFAALMRRHGPMVLGVCRRVLNDGEDALDAYQATFLILVLKAGTVRRRDSVASWLYGIARHVSLRIRRAEARRREHERLRLRISDAPTGGPFDAHEAVHDEVARLPAKFREAVVLCYLEGLTAEAAAERLGCPRGTILSRLSRARDRLRGQLARRGLAVPAALITAGMTARVDAALSPALCEQTYQALLSGQVSPAVNVAAGTTMQTLTRGVVIAKLQVGTAVLAVGCMAYVAWAMMRDDGISAQVVPFRRVPAPVDDEARSRKATALRQIGLGLLNTPERLPPAAIVGLDGTLLLSWRVAILPWIGHAELYHRFRLHEPWDSPHNRSLISEMPTLYLTTGEGTLAGGLTHFRAFGGRDSALTTPNGIRLGDVRDGMADTILVVEAEEAVPWTRPEALSVETSISPLGRPEDPDFLALFCNGEVRVIRKVVGEAKLQAAITPSGGEPIRGTEIGQVAR